VTVLPTSEHKRRLEAILAHPVFANAARSLGMAPTSLLNWQRGFLADGRTPEQALAELGHNQVITPGEIADAKFWRNKAATLEREIAEAHRLAEQLAGIRAIPVTVPKWTRATGGGKRGSVLGLHTSDVHMGEVIRPAEVDGINSYNPDICRARMERLFQAACEIGSRWAVDTECRGVFLTLGGDLISGSIHDELKETNALSSHEQVRAVVEIYCAGIALLLETFPAVHVPAVPGNHGRTTFKPTAKRYAALSYDILVASMVADRFRHDPRVTFQIAEGTDVRSSILGREVLVTHGDKLGSGGGMGFAGPALPIARGTAKARAVQNATGSRPELILTGHYHQSMNLPGVLSNGSVIGYSEYARAIRAQPETPRQWMFLMRERFGLCERLDIQLDQMGKPGRAEHVFGAVA
jgi:hypothetical protein